jgi:hypothetical protein
MPERTSLFAANAKFAQPDLDLGVDMSVLVFV